MSKREITPQVREMGYSSFLNEGLCPNTGLRCDSVIGLKTELSASHDSIALAGPSELPLSQDTTQKFYETSDKVHREFDKALADTAACIGGCALREQDE